MVYVGLMRSPFCTFFLIRILVKTMLYHDVVTLETDVATTLILDLATTLWQDQTWRRCDVVTRSLCQLGYSRVNSTHYSKWLHKFSAIIHRCYKNVYANIFFPGTIKLSISSLTRNFPLTYDRNCYKAKASRILWLFLVSIQSLC